MHIEFLHCNSCFAYSSFATREEQIRFWLTECGHVVCQSCLYKSEPNKVNSSTPSEPTCSVCNTKCATVELTEKLPPNLNMFFRPAHEILDEASDFQQKNTFSLLGFLKDKVVKQEQMLHKMKTELLQNRDMKNQLQVLEEENQWLKTQLQEARLQTPELPMRLNISPRVHPESPSKNHTQYHVSSKKLRTPNPPSRLSLSTTNSPTRATYNQEKCYIRSDTQFKNQSSWNDSVENYEGFDGGGMANPIVVRCERRIMPPFVESKFKQYSQQQSVQLFFRSSTASSTRMTWNEGKLTIHILGSREHSKFPLTRELPPTVTNFQEPSRSRSLKRPYSSASRYDVAPFLVSHQPRTPISRNRGALPRCK
ncbi:63_t:CDS:2 [Acaulospora morrowiae]|uniref:63_t:CDS:1 n=1 Tax=Acaulospora morrowiae TaxID=94023 RepID=A0A9N9A299_9GLOM|nr:63_t:CDS:2 [Acaulospora morrowiae]